MIVVKVFMMKMVESGAAENEVKVEAKQIKKGEKAYESEESRECCG